jgi:hypothetical protein
MKWFLLESDATTASIIINGDRENGAGENDANDTRYPPRIQWWDASTDPATQSDTTKVSFSTAGNYSTYIISGGQIGQSGGEAICTFYF